MKPIVRNALYWVPAWVAVSIPVGASRGWCPATVHWAECASGSLAYTGLAFAAGYWIAHPFAKDRPWVKAVGALAGVAVFYAFTAIGR